MLEWIVVGSGGKKWILKDVVVDIVKCCVSDYSRKLRVVNVNS
jgi:hypothetical protein